MLHSASRSVDLQYIALSNVLRDLAPSTKIEHGDSDDPNLYKALALFGNYKLRYIPSCQTLIGPKG